MNPNLPRDITRKDRAAGLFHEGEHTFAQRPGVIESQSRVPVALIPIQGTPVAAVAATGTTAMTGANNDWDLTAVVAGTAGNGRSLSVVVEADKADAPEVAIVDGAVTITAGDKAIMRVTGTLTNGADPVVFDDLLYAGVINGKHAWSNQEETKFTNWSSDLSTWFLLSDTVTWTSTDDVDTPDLVTTWTPEGSATGTPTVTALPHTAAQCKTAFDATAANESLFTVANKTGNDGTGSVVPTGPVTLSGGIDGTVAPKGTEMFDADFRYIAVTDTTKEDSSGWKKTALSAL
jgi:hypothetical protein